MPKMTSLTDFHNNAVIGARPDGLVLTGDVFVADDAHAMQLRQLGYAADWVEVEVAPVIEVEVEVPQTEKKKRA